MKTYTTPKWSTTWGHSTEMVKVYVDEKLDAMPYAQAGVRFRKYNGAVEMVLVSYLTDVIIVRAGLLACTGTYSATTRKHIGAFMREYFGASYYDAKKAYELNACYQVDTGRYLKLSGNDVIDAETGEIITDVNVADVAALAA